MRSRRRELFGRMNPGHGLLQILGDIFLKIADGNGGVVGFSQYKRPGKTGQSLCLDPRAEWVLCARHWRRQFRRHPRVSQPEKTRQWIIELYGVKEDVKRKVHSIIDKFAERGLCYLAVAKQAITSSGSIPGCTIRVNTSLLNKRVAFTVFLDIFATTSPVAPLVILQLRHPKEPSILKSGGADRFSDMLSSMWISASHALV
ncbi:Uncharacterized protein Fot_33422 [Forsythia ovata]|uniref:Uncharacterized protein n=1 Tax=Forsythia ovata TaxID=205694 RepID=A0ABD1TAK8_9LAMI